MKRMCDVRLEVIQGSRQLRCVTKHSCDRLTSGAGEVLLKIAEIATKRVG